MRGTLQRHLPEPRPLLSVFAAIAGLVYSWSILASFYMLPSWLFYLGTGQLAAVYAYMLLAAFADSLLLFVVVVMADVVLLRWLLGGARFAARSLVIVLGLLVSVISRLDMLRHVPPGEAFAEGEPRWWLLTAAFVALLVVAVQSSARLGRLLGGLAERSTIFLLIYMPLTLIAAVAVIWRLVV